MFLNPKYTNVHRTLLAAIKPALNHNAFERNKADASFALKKLMLQYNELRGDLRFCQYPEELTEFLFTYECALITLDDFLSANALHETSSTIQTCFQYIETAPVLLRRVSMQYRMQRIQF